MAKAITKVAIGAAAIGAAVLIPGGGIAIGSLLISHAAAVGALSSIAGSEIMAGLADALKGNQGGIAVGVTTPIGPWGYLYGRGKVGGVEIFRQSNNNTGGGGTTSNNKQLHRVYALNCHSSSIGSWQLRIDGKQVLVRASGSGYQSYSSTQIQANIISISRVDGLVTMHLDAAIADQDGSSLQVRSSADNSFNGTWIVTQPNPTDASTFTFACGGVDATSSGGNARTTYSDYKDKIYVEFLNGHHSSTFWELLSAGTNWSATDLCLGRTLAYVQMGYDDGVFPSSIPNVSFVLDGKDDILDPRTGARGFTKNAALCIADYLSLPPIKGGFGMTIGTDIPTAQLIAAANICDEAVALAAGGTVPRYECNTFFQLNMGRGVILEQMLTSCAGRISYQGGQYSIFPAAWVSPTLQLGPGDLCGPIKTNSRHSIRDTCNAVKGTYISPENAYQQGDVPPYMQDYMHGYGLITDPGQGDAYLLEDGGERIFKESNFPCTNNAATAQRLAKIGLLRMRHQERVTLLCKMKAYQAVALDVIQFSHPRYGWVNKNFEVLVSKFIVDKSNGAPTLAVQLDLAATDPSIFDWSTTEELTPQGYKQPNNVGAQVVSPPEGMVLYSGPGTTTSGITYPSTISKGADGIARNSMFVLWTPPNDSFVTSGGEIEIQWQAAGASAWTEFGKVHGATKSCFIAGVTDGQSYNVRIRAINVAGYPSDWVEAGPHIESDTVSIFTSSSGFNALGWTATQLIVVNYTVTNSGVSFTWAAQGVLQADGSTLTVPAGSLAYTGLSASTTYYTYWFVDAVTGVLGQANANPPASTPDALLSAQCSANGRIAIPVISFTTLAATNTGTGGGTGGGGDTCPESAELVETRDRGMVRAGDVKVGDFLKGKSFKTDADVFRQVIQVRSVQSTSWRIVDGHRVSPCEAVYSDGQWIPAYRAQGATLDSMLGLKIQISLESDEYDEQNYYLTSGSCLLIHNFNGISLPC